MSKIQTQATHNKHCHKTKDKQDTGTAQITYRNVMYTIYHGRNYVLSAAETGVLDSGFYGDC